MGSDMSPEAFCTAASIVASGNQPAVLQVLVKLSTHPAPAGLEPMRRLGRLGVRANRPTERRVIAVKDFFYLAVGIFFLLLDILIVAGTIVGLYWWVSVPKVM